MGSGSGLSPEQRHRAHRFVWTMVVVLGGFVAAAIVYGLWHLTWLAVVLVVASGVGRWAAMLIADANPPALPRNRGRR